MFFYPHDYGGLELHGKRYGEHVADLEHVRVLVSATEPHTIVRVHYAAHGFFEGRWMEPSELQYHDNDTRKRAMVYVACNGHGSYPHPGKYVRLFGIAPDKMDGKGRRWNVNGLVEGYPDVLLGYRCGVWGVLCTCVGGGVERVCGCLCTRIVTSILTYYTQWEIEPRNPQRPMSRVVA